MKDFCLNKSNYKEKKVRKFQKEILVSSIFQKTNEIFSLISALASKKWSNQKRRGIYYKN